MGRKRAEADTVSRRTRSRQWSSEDQPPPATELAFDTEASSAASSPTAPVSSLGLLPPPVRFGKYEMDPWFPSPLHEKYLTSSMLFFCQFCLEYTKNQASFQCHCQNCPSRRPPGKMIYRSPKLSVFKIDAACDQLYCERLSLFAKLFLKDKSVGASLAVFYFYVLCEVNADNEHTIVGYFSKEKKSTNTLGCILTLPPFQRLGYGRFLIQLSYELAKQAKQVGSPEGPLSELGQRSFLAYWKRTLLPLVAQKRRRQLVLGDLVKQTAIDAQDIMFVFEELGLLVGEPGGRIVLHREKLEHELAQLGAPLGCCAVDRRCFL